MKLILSLCLAFWALPALALREIPALTGPVIDEVGLLNEREKAHLTQRLQAMKNLAQLQIWIVTDLGSDSIEDLSIRAVEKWKLGDAQKDNGLLFTIAPRNKRMRIEVGRGLEGNIPDILTGRILDNDVRPAFRQGHFYDGILTAVERLNDLALGGDTAAKAASEIQEKSPSGGSGFLNILIILFWLVFIFVIPFLGRRGGRGGIYTSGFGGGWGSGGGGGSSWSGGGGSFGGGGSSSSW